MASTSVPSPTSVIIIGAGFGGLSAGIELARRGAKVQIFEAVPDMSRQGDVIQIGANATRLMEPWGRVLPEITKLSALPSIMSIQDKNGKLLLDQTLHTEYEGYPNAYGNRGKIQSLLYQHAFSLGVKVNFGMPVTSIFETSSTAGIQIQGPEGEKYEAHCVIAADGVRSLSRSYVTGISEKPKKSGFAVYRSWFPLSALAEDPLTAPIARAETPLFKIWIAEDTHAILTTNWSMKAATCFVTHKDTSDIREDWNLPGNVADMQACVDGWDPTLRGIISHIPADCLIDYKLLWRDPVRKWVSDQGRVCLLGDAAHPHLATSGTGAAQAIEGAATIGALMEASGMKHEEIPLVFRAYEKLRYERTSLTQRMGWETRHVWHQTDWDAVATNPDVLKLPQPAWLLGHDAGEYAKQRYDEVVNAIKNDAPFKSTNVPEGHVHDDWTIETMLAYEGLKVEKDFYKSRGE
ncbi:FAD/NAD(P)-binding domain-containing protein [Thozetella sp. PMI_491]|nr:FAD/NAD(P)-binding domain-containing protein [Thozetella sp. PMI_491]